MKKYVSLDKRSKKEQREYHSRQRSTWGELNPVTRSVPSAKEYNRKKEKKRIGKEFRDEFGADSFVCRGMIPRDNPPNNPLNNPPNNLPIL